MAWKTAVDLRWYFYLPVFVTLLIVFLVREVRWWYTTELNVVKVLLFCVVRQTYGT
jgi:hypothetical protein